MAFRVFRCLVCQFQTSEVRVRGVVSKLPWSSFPPRGFHSAASAFPRFLHPRRYQVLVDAPDSSSESHCCSSFTRGRPRRSVPNLYPLWPLPAESDSSRRISRSAGRLRDWSKCKLHHSPESVKPCYKPVIPGSILYTSTKRRLIPIVIHSMISNRFYLGNQTVTSARTVSTNVPRKVPSKVRGPELQANSRRLAR